VYSAILVQRQDITGDGYADYLILGECPSPTSSWPQIVFVVDGASDPAAPRLLGRLGTKDYFRGAQVSVSGTGRNATIVVSGQGLSKNAALCCPDIILTIKYRWSGQTLKEVGRRQIPI